MNKYELLETIGEGAYGVVIKAKVKDTGALVAIKRFKESEEEQLVQKTSMREVKVLRSLRDVPYIVSLIEAFRRKGRLYLVFDYIGKNVLELMEERPNGISEPEVRRMVYTMLLAMHACHAHGIIHRDIKPENLLVWSDGTLRLCDFGFARFLSEGAKDLTDYVATRWYRSPELLLGTSDYGLPSDLWAAGCIMAEMIDGQPLFPAETELDQLRIISKGLGPLTPEQYEVFGRTPRFSTHSLSANVRSEQILDRKFDGRVSKAALQVLKALVQVDPARRPTVSQALCMPWFDGLAQQYCPQGVNITVSTPLMLQQQQAVKQQQQQQQPTPQPQQQQQQQPVSNSQQQQQGQQQQHHARKGTPPSYPQQQQPSSTPTNFDGNNNNNSKIPPIGLRPGSREGSTQQQVVNSNRSNANTNNSFMPDINNKNNNNYQNPPGSANNTNNNNNNPSSRVGVRQQTILQQQLTQQQQQQQQQQQMQQQPQSGSRVGSGNNNNNNNTNNSSAYNSTALNQQRRQQQNLMTMMNNNSVYSQNQQQQQQQQNPQQNQNQQQQQMMYGDQMPGSMAMMMSMNNNNLGQRVGSGSSNNQQQAMMNNSTTNSSTLPKLHYPTVNNNNGGVQNGGANPVNGTTGGGRPYSRGFL